MFTVHLIVLPRVHHYWSLLRIPISKWRLQAAPRCLQAFQHQLQRGAPEAGSLQRPWHQGDDSIISGCLKMDAGIPIKIRNFTGKTRWLTIKLRDTLFSDIPGTHLFKNMLESWDDEGTVPVPNNPQPLALSTRFFWKFKKSSLKLEDVWNFHILSTTPRWL